jgi:hypothetical protein
MTPKFDNLASLLMEGESPEERVDRIKDMESRGYGKSKRIPMPGSGQTRSRVPDIDDDMKEPIKKSLRLEPKYADPKELERRSREDKDGYYYTKAFRDMLEPRTFRQVKNERELERKDAAADRQRARRPAYLARKKDEAERYLKSQEYKDIMRAREERIRNLYLPTRDDDAIPGSRGEFAAVKQFVKEVQRLEHVDQDKRL